MCICPIMSVSICSTAESQHSQAPAVWISASVTEAYENKNTTTAVT